MKNALKKDNILLNVVVWADYKLRDDPDAVVLGVDYSGVSYVLEPEGQFSTRSSPVEITQASSSLSLPLSSSFFILSLPLSPSLLHPG